MIGGHESYPSLLAHEYDVRRSCLLIDLSSAIVSEKSLMSIGREAFGVGHINNYIYAVAGVNEDYKSETSMERYDLSTDKWCFMPNAEFDKFTEHISLIVSAKRYLLAFGGNWVGGGMFYPT